MNETTTEELICEPQECPPFTATVSVDLYDKPVETYDWRAQAGGLVKPYCLLDNAWMSWAMKIDRRYPDTPNKTTAHKRRQVFYKGRLVQVWQCKGQCGQWVVK